MSTANAVSITLMIAGIPMLIPALTPLFRKQYDRRVFLIAASAALHLVATLYAVSIGISACNPDATGIGWLMFMLSFFIGLCAGVTLLCAAFCEPDGKIRFWNRKTPIPVLMLGCALLPVLLASTGQHFYSEINLVQYGFSLSILLTYLCFRREAGVQIETKAADLELRQAKLLTEQIQPHIIFNVLMSIQNLCYQDADAAADCIAQFAGYLRGNMAELEHIRTYEVLEHACTDQPFVLEYEIAADDFEIPALTVQPIVENAIKHGALSRRDGAGKALLKTERIGQCIKITVSDNGNVSANLTAQQKTHQSIGLKNVENRLAVQCGGTLNISLNPDGAKVTILISEKGAISRADNHR